MAPLPQSFADLRHLTVSLESVRAEDIDPVYAMAVLLDTKKRWPFAHGGELRLPHGFQVEGVQCSIFRDGAAFYDARLRNESLTVVATAVYDCTFKRIDADLFQLRLPMLGSAFRDYDRRARRPVVGPRYGGRRPPLRLDVVFVVDEITTGSSKFKMTLLVVAMVGGAIAGTGNLIAQYPAIKEGALMLIKDAGFIARELEPIEQHMCEMEYEA